MYGGPWAATRWIHLADLLPDDNLDAASSARRRIGRRFSGDAHIFGPGALMVVPMTGQEFVIMVLFITGLWFLTGGMVGTGSEVVLVVWFLTGVGGITGLVLVARLSELLMTYSHTGFEDSGQMGIDQE